MEKRVIFTEGAQSRFLKRILQTSDITQNALARGLKAHPRSMSDWIHERYSLPLNVLQAILKKYPAVCPPRVVTRSAFWYTSDAGRHGGIAHYKKYGTVAPDEEKRRRAWLKWWKRKGQYNKNSYFCIRPVVIPKRNSSLAEFVGIMIGDGGITERQVTVTLNYKDDKKYILFVLFLMRSLFGTQPSIYRRESESVDNLTISRTKLVRFCLSIGLKKGNKLKQNLDIPSWVQKNEKFAKACVRGIMDTDGCVFAECHNVGRKRYCYPRLSITSASPQLLDSIADILRKFGFSPRIRMNRSVNLERREDIMRYFKTIGSSNPKHLRRLKQSGGVG